MISEIPIMVRRSRRAAGLTQADLARRLGTTQSGVARLERAGSNPTVETLERALAATGHRLEVRTPRALPAVDESQIVANLALSPTERLRRFTATHRNLRDLVSKVRPAVGDAT